MILSTKFVIFFSTSVFLHLSLVFFLLFDIQPQKLPKKNLVAKIYFEQKSNVSTRGEFAIIKSGKLSSPPLSKSKLISKIPSNPKLKASIKNSQSFAIVKELRQPQKLKFATENIKVSATEEQNVEANLKKLLKDTKLQTLSSLKISQKSITDILNEFNSSNDDRELGSGNDVESELLSLDDSKKIASNSVNLIFDRKFYQSKIAEKVKSNWKNPLSNPKLNTIIVVNILEDGDIKSYEVLRKSKNVAFDNSAKKAIMDSIPFPKFPESFQFKNFSVKFRFSQGKLDLF